jgi:Mrp family chromosome partitioning ATPase
MHENNTAASHIPAEEYRLDLHSVLRDIAAQWLSVVLLSAAAVLLSFVLLSFSRKPVYKTTSTVAIRNINEDSTVNNVTTKDLYNVMKSSGESAGFLKKIITQGDLNALISAELGDYRKQGSISADSLGEGNFLALNVTASSPEASLRENEALIRVLQKQQDNLIGGLRIIVVQEPKVLETAVNAGRNVKLSLFAGVVVFLLLCTLLAWYSSSRYTVRNSTEVIPKVGMRALAVVPEEKRRRGGNGILITNPAVTPGYTEEMCGLAIRLMNEMTREGQKTLLVSSAAEGEGKSTTAANIALAMSRMNRKVILADMDFQNPSLAKILNMQDAQFTELEEYLESVKSSGAASADSLGRLLCKVPGTELMAVLNTKAAPQSLDKYAAQIRELLADLSEKADFVIVDTTSTAVVSDAEELASMTDASVVVVRENFAEVSDITNAAKLLSSGGPVLGCVFNGARRTEITADAARARGGLYVG